MVLKLLLRRQAPVHGYARGPCSEEVRLVSLNHDTNIDFCPSKAHLVGIVLDVAFKRPIYS